jgi:hypothetical protein
MSLTKQILDGDAVHVMPGHMEMDWTNWEREEVEDFDYPHGGTSKPFEMPDKIPAMTKQRFNKAHFDNLRLLGETNEEKNDANDKYLDYLKSKGLYEAD